MRRESCVLRCEPWVLDRVACWFVTCGARRVAQQYIQSRGLWPHGIATHRLTIRAAGFRSAGKSRRLVARIRSPALGVDSRRAPVCRPSALVSHLFDPALSYESTAVQHCFGWVGSEWRHRLAWFGWPGMACHPLTLVRLETDEWESVCRLPFID